MQQTSAEARPSVFVTGQRVTFDYANWRGELSFRVAEPISLRHGATEWHPEPQWLLLARDEKRGADREFALDDMTPADGTTIVFESGQGVTQASVRGLPGCRVFVPNAKELLFAPSFPGAPSQWLIEANGSPTPVPLSGLTGRRGWGS